MKKWIGPGSLALLAVAAVYFGVKVHEWIVPFNYLPIAVWVAVLLLGQRRWPALGNPATVILGMVYGGLVGVGAGAGFLLMLTVALTDRYNRYPYDTAAFTLILLLAMLLFLAVGWIDYRKTGWRSFWVRVATALVAFFPSMLLAMHLMAYFEEKLSHFVR